MKIKKLKGGETTEMEHLFTIEVDRDLYEMDEEVDELFVGLEAASPY